jgi:cytochrome c-type biogenesis protein CcmF
VQDASFGVVSAILACWLAATVLLVRHGGCNGFARRSLARYGAPLAALGTCLMLLTSALMAWQSHETDLTIRESETAVFGTCEVRLVRILPQAGKDWTALEGEVKANCGKGKSAALGPQMRSYFQPWRDLPVEARLTRWNGTLRVLLIAEATQSRWRFHFAWRAWEAALLTGGVLAALGALLMAAGNIASILRRADSRGKIAYRRLRQGR